MPLKKMDALKVDYTELYPAVVPPLPKPSPPQSLSPNIQQFPKPELASLTEKNKSSFSNFHKPLSSPILGTEKVKWSSELRQAVVYFVSYITVIQ